MKVDREVSGETGVAEETELGKYVPAWDIPSSLTMGGLGVAMTFFQHYFPPGLKKTIEAVPTKVLIDQMYQQKSEVRVGGN